MIFEHNISPIIFEAGPLAVRWYGLLFALGLVGAYLVTLWGFKKKGFKAETLDSLAVYLFVGMVVGARLGHVFFYSADYFLAHPLEILMVWKGGLASHGGALGIFIAYLVWIWVHKVGFSKYADVGVLGIPLLATFVRLGNFFNSEIVGNATDGSWGVIFKKLGEDFPRHPVQLYSSLMNLTIFAIMVLLFKKYYKTAPVLFFLFFYMLLYFGGRFVVEYWKDLHGPLENIPLDMGQLLSIVPILISIVYFVFFFPKKSKARR